MRLPPRRRRRWWLFVLLIPAAVVVLILLPLFHVGYLAAHDALNPLADRPAPYAHLPASSSSVPAGDITFDSNTTGNFEISVLDPTTGKIQQLTHDRRYDSWWARISPDRTHILFYRAPRGVHDTDPSQNSLWVMDADGSHQIDLRPSGTDAWRLQGHAEWSPSGTQLVMSGGGRFSPQIYVTTSTGRDPVNVSNRGGTNIDPSWAPSGKKIVFIGCPHSLCTTSDYQVYSLNLSHHARPVQLTQGSHPNYDPYISPNGRQLAWLRETVGGNPGQWNIMIANVNGSDQRNLTDDSNVNSKPSWSSSGQLIYFHRLVVGTTHAFGIWVIRPDGSDLHPLLPAQGSVSYEYPGT